MLRCLVRPKNIQKASAMEAQWATGDWATEPSGVQTPQSLVDHDKDFGLSS